MVVSLKTDLRFPIPGQQGHGGRIIHKRAESDLDGIVSYIAVELVDPQTTTEDLGGEFGCRFRLSETILQK